MVRAVQYANSTLEAAGFDSNAVWLGVVAVGAFSAFLALGTILSVQGRWRL